MSFKVAYSSFEGGMNPPFNYVVKLQICFIDGDCSQDNLFIRSMHFLIFKF